LISTRTLIEQAFRRARITAEGQTDITEDQRQTGLRLLGHIINSGFHDYTIAFGKKRLNLPMVNGSAVLPPEYAHVSHTVFVHSGSGAAVTLKRATEDEILSAKFASAYNGQIPSRYAVDYDSNGVVTVTTDSNLSEGSLGIAAIRRILPPKSLDDDIDAPPEWETPLEYALAVMLCSEYGVDTPAQVAGMAKSAWDQIYRMHPVIGSISRG